MTAEASSSTAGSSSSDVMLEQMVRYASTQWDSSGRLLTRAGAIVALSGTAMVGSITLLTSITIIALLTKVGGFLLLAVSIYLAGQRIASVDWSVPPALSVPDIEAAQGFPPEAVKKSLVTAYVEACAANDTTLRLMGSKLNLATILTVVAILLLAASYAAGKAGV